MVVHWLRVLQRKALCPARRARGGGAADKNLALLCMQRMRMGSRNPLSNKHAGRSSAAPQGPMRPAGVLHVASALPLEGESESDGEVCDLEGMLAEELQADAEIWEAFSDEELPADAAASCGGAGGSGDEVACGGAAQELGGPRAGCSEEGAGTALRRKASTRQSSAPSAVQRCCWLYRAQRARAELAFFHQRQRARGRRQAAEGKATG